MTAKRLRIRVRGAVQGVGFRPYVHGLAEARGLTGWVQNDADGVLIEVEGAGAAAFADALPQGLPPLARIDGMAVSEIAGGADTGFVIKNSQAGTVATLVIPDAAICPDCVADLFDPGSRYYRYAFVNCTHCGPRYTITRSLPYDRAQTAMAAFAMCDPCAAAYHDPADRRFHAQPVACAACGPKLSLDLVALLDHLRGGAIVALKGLGGFHLVCDARNDAAVSRLRQGKLRESKPFAVMAANLASIRTFADCDEDAAALLRQTARPIVLLKKRTDTPLAADIAPGLADLGVMLPYTPIHYLLFNAAAGQPDGTGWLDDVQDLVLVMTSANPGGEPLVTGNEEARRRLAGIADVIVDHDRDILIRADDSVLAPSPGGPVFIRRARGFVPQPIRLSRAVPPVLALGGHLKNTVCVTRGDEAFVSQHIGTMDNVETVRFFEETVDHLLTILDVEPALVAHDLHPDFQSSRFARDSGLPLCAVQHHHAHLAAVQAEQRIDGPVLGLILDGFGLGADGGSWGGELLWGDATDYRRLGHFSPLAQPGGDVAAREPWRLAAAALQKLGRGDEITARFADRPAATTVAQMLARGTNCPETSSAGRLFDAAAGLLDLCPISQYEGQAPMRLEALVDVPRVLPDGWRITGAALDFTPLLAALTGQEARAGAELFHGTLIAGLADWTVRAAKQTGCRRVVFAGGCFLNRVLAVGLGTQLRERGLEPLMPRQVPPNDGGLSLGQAWIAAQQ